MDELKLNNHNLCGFDLPFLNYGVNIAESVFPDFLVREVEKQTDYGSSNALEVCASDSDKVLFTILQDGFFQNPDEEKLMQAYSCNYLYCDNPEVVILDGNRVGLTRFSDFKCSYVRDGGFMVDGSKFLFSSDMPDAPFGAILYFDAPSDYEGDFREATPEILGDCVLSEARFYLRNNPYRKANEIGYPFSQESAKQQMKSLKKSHYAQSYSKNTVYSILPFKTLISDVLKDRFDSSAAEKAYLSLAETAIYSVNKEQIKAQIKSLFSEYVDRSAAFYFSHILEFNKYKSEELFIARLDLESEIKDLNWIINILIKYDDSAIELPTENDYPENKGLGLPGIIEDYSQALQNSGYALHQLNDGSDEFVFFIAPLKNKKKVNTIISKISF